MMKLEFENGWNDEHGSHIYDDPQGLLKATNIVMDAFNTLRKGDGRLSGFQYRSLRDMLRGAKSTGKKTQNYRCWNWARNHMAFNLG